MENAPPDPSHSPTPVPPPPHLPDIVPSGPTISFKEKAGPYLAKAKAFGLNQASFFKRFLQGATGEPKPTVDELPLIQPLLATRPALVQWMLWRRALLALCMTVLAFVTIKEIFFQGHSMKNGFYDQGLEMAEAQAGKNGNRDEIKKQAQSYADGNVQALGEGNVLKMNIWSWLPAILATGTLLMVWQSERNWTNLALSRRWALLATSVVIAPLLIYSLIPLEALMDYSHLQGEQKVLVTAGIKGMFALMSVIMIAPLLLGIANGVVRGSLVSRNLVPAATLCGWVTVIVAAFLSLAWLITLGLVIQTTPGGLLMFAMLLILAGPVSLLVRWKTLCRDAITTTVVSSVNLTFLGLSYFGIILAFIFMVRSDNAPFAGILGVILHYAANLLLVLVVTVDLMILFMRSAYPQLHENTPAAVAELTLLE